VKEKTGSLATLNGPSKLGVVTGLAIILGTLALLSISVTAQEMTAGDWYKKGQEMYDNGSYQEALEAYDEVLKMDPQNASAWHYRGMALASMGRGVEANQSFQKSMGYLDQMLQEDPEDPEALWLMAEGMDLLGRSEEALEAYSLVAELNSSHALAAWVREADIMAAFGRYNQSAEAFSSAMALVPANRSQSQLEFHWQSENATIFTKAWIIDGQIHRVSIGLYNISSESFDEIQQINSDFVAALQLKGSASSAADPGRHGGTPISSINWDMYIFELPEMTATARPPTLTITGINPKGDEFIEVTNGMKETVSLQNWSFEIQGSIVMLPQHYLLSGKAVRIHLGSGQENGTDLFLDCDLELDDTAGSVSLRDDSGAKVALLTYWTKLDGSIAHSVAHFVTTKSDLESSGASDQEEMAQKAVDVGPFVAERAEISPKSVHNSHSKRDGLQEETVDYWMNKAQELYHNGSIEEAISAYDEALKIDPENATIWQTKGSLWAIIGKKDEALIAHQNALDLFNQTIEKNPEDAEAWRLKAETLRLMNRLDEAVIAYDVVIELQDQKNADSYIAWSALESKAGVLMELGRYNESIEAYDRAIAQIPANNTELQAFVYSTKGMYLNNLGRYEEAVEAYDKALEISDEQSHTYLPALQNKGMALLDMGSYEEAIETFDQVIEIDPNFGGWYGKGQALKALGRYNESIAAFDESLEQYPDNPLIWVDKGEVLQALGHHEEAIKAYDEAIKTAGSSPFFIDVGTSAKAWHNKGLSLEALGRTSESEAAFAMAMEMGYKASSAAQEMDADSWMETGQTLLENGAFEEANVAFNKALEIYNGSIEADPQDSKAWVGVGDALSRMTDFGWDREKFNSSLEAYERALEIDPENVDAWIGKGRILCNTEFAVVDGVLYDDGRHNESLEAFERALEIDPSNPGAWKGKAFALSVLGRIDESLAAFDKAIEHLPVNQSDEIAYVFAAKGNVLQYTPGRQEEAIAAFDMALATGSENCSDMILVLNGTALKDLGRYNESVEAFDEILELNSSNINVWIDNADALVAADRLEEAEKAYGEAETRAATNQTLAQVWLSKAVTLRGLGRFDEAISTYDRAIELYLICDSSGDLYPGYAKIQISFAWDGKGDALNQTGRYEEAVRAYDRAIEFSPSEFAMYRSMIYAKKSALLEKVGRHEEALEAFDKAVEISPEYAPAWQEVVSSSH